MTKRQCLTCGYFNAAPSDGVGWCHHPKRKHTSDIKLFVRGAELPCRNDWDHDLWEDKTNFSGQVDFVLDNTSGPLAPVSLDDVVFLTSGQRAMADGAPDSAAEGSAVDRVISEETTFNPAAISPRGSIRGSVRRAHQHVLAEKRVERFADGGAPAFDGGFSVPVEQKSPIAPVDARVYEADRPNRANGDYTATRPVFSPVPPVTPSEMDRSIRKIAIYPGEEDRFSSIPRPVEGMALPTAAKRDGADSVIRSSFTEDDATVEQRWTAPAPEAKVAEARFIGEAQPVVTQLSYRDERPPDDLQTETPPAHIEAGAPSIDEGAGVEDEYIPAPRRHRSRGGGLFRSRRKPIVESLDENDGVWDEIPRMAAAPRIDRTHPIEAGAPVLPPNERTMAPVVERIPAPIVERTPEPVANRDIVVESYDGYATFPEPLQTALWTDVPRMCRTCRDFRPAESGDRGWCTNKWAFNHRRMVDAVERPCDSSVGCWWLPHDEIWLAASDISAHGQPTPLLDLWLGQRHDRDFEQDSAPVRRRQRG